MVYKMISRTSEKKIDLDLILEKIKKVNNKNSNFIEFTSFIPEDSAIEEISCLFKEVLSMNLVKFNLEELDAFYKKSGEIKKILESNNDYTCLPGLLFSIRVRLVEAIEV